MRILPIGLGYADDPDLIAKVLTDAVASEVDLVLLIGGSSAGAGD